MNSAKNKVNGLQNEINKYDGEKKHCKHWYDVSCKTHNGWLDTKIAALWVAKHAADAALDVANDALKVAKDAVSDASKVVANIKPECVELPSPARLSLPGVVCCARADQSHRPPLRVRPLQGCQAGGRERRH